MLKTDYESAENVVQGRSPTAVRRQLAVVDTNPVASDSTPGEQTPRRSPRYGASGRRDRSRDRHHRRTRGRRQQGPVNLGALTLLRRINREPGVLSPAAQERNGAPPTFESPTSHRVRSDESMAPTRLGQEKTPSRSQWPRVAGLGGERE